MDRKKVKSLIVFTLQDRDATHTYTLALCNLHKAHRKELRPNSVVMSRKEVVSYFKDCPFCQCSIRITVIDPEYCAAPIEEDCFSASGKPTCKKHRGVFEYADMVNAFRDEVEKVYPNLICPWEQDERGQIILPTGFYAWKDGTYHQEPETQ